MLLGVSGMTAYGAPAYSDTAGHWGEAAIEKWSEYGVLQGNGDGTFAPERFMTVDELATVLANSFGYTESYKGELPGYTGTWGEEAVRKAIAAGALTAAEAPEELTRELAAKIMAKALGITPAGGESKFSDDYAVTPKYKPYVNALGKKGVFNGDTRGRFMPEAGFKRAEVMQVFDNTLGDIIGADKAVELDKGALINKGGVTLSESSIDGDLYIGQGVGDGDVTLEDVAITGRLVVFGGGSGSIHIKGASVIPNVVVNKTFGQPARISVESAEAVVGIVALAAGGKSTVETVEGALIEKIELPSELSVTDEGEVVPVKSATVAEVKIAAAAETVEIASEGAKVELTAKAQIETLAVESEGAAVSVDAGATVKEATVSASDVSISGAGKVDAVTVTEEAESGVTIKTSGTAVTVDENAGAVTTGGGTTIDAGTTAPSKPDTGSSGGGGGSTGGGGGGGASFTVTAGLTPEAAGWATETFPDEDNDGAWDYFGAPGSAHAIGPNGGGIIDVTDGISQADLVQGVGAIHTFFKIVYSGYTFTGDYEDLNLVFKIKGDGSANTDAADILEDRFYHDADNKTIYYFDGLTVATLDNDNGALYYPNARPGTTVPVDVSLPGISGVKTVNLAIPAVGTDPALTIAPRAAWGGDLNAVVAQAFDKQYYKITLSGDITGVASVGSGDPFYDGSDLSSGYAFFENINLTALLGVVNGSKVTINQTNPALTSFYQQGAFPGGVKYKVYTIADDNFGTNDPYLEVIFDGNAQGKTVTIEVWKSEVASGSVASTPADITIVIDYSAVVVTSGATA
jgi:hypothetical protein